MRSRQRGLAGALVAVVLVVAAAIALATLALSRATSSSARNKEVAAQFQVLDTALTQFVSANFRLPCPADPGLDTGAEARAGGACTSPTGTVPWMTIGARRDDALDPWSNKISYRVYTGVAGSLVQDGGASMVNCDSEDTGPRDATTGLCVASPKDTGPTSFLASKGLTVNDAGTVRSDAAFLLISHGSTGLGAYTAAGLQRDLPPTGGDERANTEASSTFVIKSFSAPGVDSATTAHFDDFLHYRRTEDLIRKAGVYARNWPEEAGTTPTAVAFSQGVVETAVGGTVTPGSAVGQVSVTFTGVVASNPVQGSTEQIGFDVVGGYGGIGVAGGGSSLLQSATGEKLRLSFTDSFTKFGVTLNGFGYYSGQFFEIVEFRFRLGEFEVGSPRYGVGCNIDGGLASFTMDASVLFDSIEIKSYPAYDLVAADFVGNTAFLVTEIKACPATETTCVTSLAAPGNNCAVF
jgi:type II secretory pathway pseudopilin PulG